MRRFIAATLFLTLTLLLSNCKQEEEETIDLLNYTGTETYDVTMFEQEFDVKKPKNVILMIGDGMGVAHVYAGLTANGGHLFMENCKYTGYVKTYSADNYITQSAAAGTAISTGKKTYNGAAGVIDVGTDTIPVATILEEAEAQGIATGMISTASITDATPASFIAHNKSRYNYEEIATDFLKTDIDLFIGGGLKHFTERRDSIDLTIELKNLGYQVYTEMDSLIQATSGKIAGLLAPVDMPWVEERKDMLPVSTNMALNLLDNDSTGFFLMVEGAMIDKIAHTQNGIAMIPEILDFDQAVGVALEFASIDKNTLVIITADHETGGLSLVRGDIKEQKVSTRFGYFNHTAVMVPIFAFGPGAENFMGIMENTDIYYKIKELLLN